MNTNGIGLHRNNDAVLCGDCSGFNDLYHLLYCQNNIFDECSGLGTRSKAAIGLVTAVGKNLPAKTKAYFKRSNVQLTTCGSIDRQCFIKIINRM